jgi:hypothetical protein
MAQQAVSSVMSGRGKPSGHESTARPGSAYNAGVSIVAEAVAPLLAVLFVFPAALFAADVQFRVGLEAPPRVAL